MNPHDQRQTDDNHKQQREANSQKAANNFCNGPDNRNISNRCRNLSKSDDS